MITVPIKSAWASKINWTQAVSAFAMLIGWASGNAIELSADKQTAIVVTIGVIGNIVTWIMKTWFTTTITPSSAAK
jgi:hypothetical protein